jgi:hypothetical protein
MDPAARSFRALVEKTFLAKEIGTDRYASTSPQEWAFLLGVGIGDVARALCSGKATVESVSNDLAEISSICLFLAESSGISRRSFFERVVALDASRFGPEGRGTGRSKQGEEPLVAWPNLLFADGGVVVARVGSFVDVSGSRSELVRLVSTAQAFYRYLVVSKATPVLSVLPVAGHA